MLGQGNPNLTCPAIEYIHRSYRSIFYDNKNRLNLSLDDGCVSGSCRTAESFVSIQALAVSVLRSANGAMTSPGLPQN